MAWGWYGTLGSLGRIYRIARHPASDYRLLRPQQRPSMNSSSTRPSKPRNDSPITVALKLRCILSWRELRHHRVELGFERHAQRVVEFVEPPHLGWDDSHLEPFLGF